MKVRIKFRKYGVMKFIGHLDIMRFFQKAMRRADIDIAYSEGYSPHQIMSFAAPLGVGVTSDGEYLDIEVKSTRSSQASLHALNAVMVEGIEVLSYRKLSDTAKNAMSIVSAAGYRIIYKESAALPCKDIACLQERLHAFFDLPAEVLITKKTKKSEKVMDLKKLVYKFFALEEAGTVSYHILLSAGSTDNVKPELVLEAFYQFLQMEFQPSLVQIHRTEVYANADNGELIPLEELGEDIV